MLGALFETEQHEHVPAFVTVDPPGSPDQISVQLMIDWEIVLMLKQRLQLCPDRFVVLVELSKGGLGFVDVEEHRTVLPTTEQVEEWQCDISGIVEG